MRLNLSKTGVGVSVGGKGIRRSVHSSGRSTTSAGVPGTGLYYRKDRRTQTSRGSGTSASPRGKRSTPATAAPGAPAAPPKPGWFAPRGEKLLYKAIRRDDLALMEQVARDHGDYRLEASTLAGVRHHDSGNVARARQLLDDVARGGTDPAGTPFWQRYVHAALTVTLEPSIAVSLPLDGTAVALLAAHLHADAGDVDAAVQVLGAWPATPANRLTAVALQRQQGNPAKVIALTEGTGNEDDVSAMLLVHRGAAFREQGHHTAAREALKEALRFRKRAPAVRHAALYERALTNAADGKRAQARKDAERILAEDATQQRVHELLQELDEPR